MLAIDAKWIHTLIEFCEKSSYFPFIRPYILNTKLSDVTG